MGVTTQSSNAQEYLAVGTSVGNNQVLSSEDNSDKNEMYPVNISKSTGRWLDLGLPVEFSPVPQPNENPLLETIYEQLGLLGGEPGALEAVFHTLEEFRNHLEERDKELEGWLASAQSSFDFWDNDEDAIYDSL